MSSRAKVREIIERERRDQLRAAFDAAAAARDAIAPLDDSIDSLDGDGAIDHGAALAQQRSIGRAMIENARPSIELAIERCERVRAALLDELRAADRPLDPFDRAIAGERVELDSIKYSTRDLTLRSDHALLTIAALDRLASAHLTIARAVVELTRKKAPAFAARELAIAAAQLRSAQRSIDSIDRWLSQPIEDSRDRSGI